MKTCVRLVFCGAAVILCIFSAACARLRIEPVQVDVKPIHVTLDINVKVQKVDAALEDFFGGMSTNAPAAAPAPVAEEN